MKQLTILLLLLTLLMTCIGTYMPIPFPHIQLALAEGGGCRKRKKKEPKDRQKRTERVTERQRPASCLLTAENAGNRAPGHETVNSSDNTHSTDTHYLPSSLS